MRLLRCVILTVCAPCLLPFSIGLRAQCRGENACGQHCPGAAEQRQLLSTVACSTACHAHRVIVMTRNSTARQPWEHGLIHSHVRRNSAWPCVHSITVSEKCTPLSRSEFGALLPQSINGSAAEGREENLASARVSHPFVSLQLVCTVPRRTDFVENTCHDWRSLRARSHISVFREQGLRTLCTVTTRIRSGEPYVSHINRSHRQPTSRTGRTLS